MSGDGRSVFDHHVVRYLQHVRIDHIHLRTGGCRLCSVHENFRPNSLCMWMEPAVLILEKKSGRKDGPMVVSSRCHTFMSHTILTP